MRSFDLKFACALIVEQHILYYWSTDAGFDDAATLIHFPIHLGCTFAENKDDYHVSVTIMVDCETLSPFPNLDVSVKLLLESSYCGSVIFDDFCRLARE